jgi:O-acetyl-ADP-ribose deacetylase (regulator of RNase III)
MRLDEAAPIALEATAAYLGHHSGAFTEVRFVLFDAPALEAFSAALAGLG